ncbi:MAG: PAS domain S-box protein, partial [Methanomicrobiales archaeon]|nr:PAS domain S-box protein [Methanomicrobiales archaeon]
MTLRALQRKKEECTQQLQAILSENDPAVIAAVRDLLDGLAEECSRTIEDLQDAWLRESRTFRSTRQQEYQEAVERAQTFAEELAATNEELRLANEELNQQNADLLAARRAADEERQRYYDLFDAAPEGYLVTDRNGEIVEANHAAGMLLSVHTESLAGRNLIHFISNRDEARTRMARAVGGESQQDFELDLLPLGGGFVCVSASIVSVSPPGAPEPSLRWMLRDVTERKRVEELAREREQILQSIFRSAPVGIGLVSDRVILRVNDTLCRMLGYAEEELVGRDARILYPDAAEYAYVGREKYRRMETAGIGTVETRWQRKDCRILDILLSSTPLDPNDLSSGIMFTALDITDRKRWETALQESEAKYRSLFDDDLTGDYICDMDGRILDCNPAFARMFGFDSVDEAEASNILETYIYPRDREALLKRLQCERKLEGLEHFRRRQDGTLIHVVENIVGIFDASGALVQTKGYIIEDTERLRAE